MPWPKKNALSQPKLFYNVSNPGFQRQASPSANSSSYMRDAEGEKVGKFPTYTGKFKKIKKLMYGF